MNRMKRFFCMLLAVCMLAAFFPVVSHAAYYSESDLTNIGASILSNAQRKNYVDTMMKYHILSSTDNYRVARNLQDGKSVLFFFDGCSDNMDSATYSDYTKYHLSAYCAVVQSVNGVPKIVYESENCSTIPDNPRNVSLNSGSAVPTVLDGVYNIISTNHLSRYASLRIADNSGSVPVMRCTSSGSYVSTSSAINIHARSNFSNTPTNGISSISYSSTGCFLVGLTNNTWSEYNSFINAIYGISKAIITTPYSNGSWTKCTTGVDKGIVIVDRANYKTQLQKIYGSDNNYTAANLVKKITSYTDNLDVEIPEIQEHGGRKANAAFDGFLPIHAYPISTGNIPVYDVNGTAYSNRYITGSTDLCIINNIFTDGWCYVSYPSSAEADGYFEAYVPLTAFIADASPTPWLCPAGEIVYCRSDLSVKLGAVDAGDACLAVSESDDRKQIVYPVTGAGYCKMGWITDVTAEKKLTGITVTTLPDKLVYTEGEQFDPTGMAVQASYSDGSVAPVTGFTTSCDLTAAGEAQVTVSYTHNDVTVTASFTVTVERGGFDAVTVTANSRVAAVLASGETAYYAFTPTTDAEYAIYSTGTSDTAVTLYTAEGTELVTADSGGDGSNFLLSYPLTSGQTYYYGVRYTDPAEAGTVPVTFGCVYTLTFDADGGTDAPEAQTKYFGKDVTLSAVLPKKEGYQFAGWAADTATYQPGDIYTAEGDATLKALWIGSCTGHSYENGVCTACGANKPDYYLFGYINGADYGSEWDYSNLGSYKFVDGKLTTTFEEDSYVAVKTGDNSGWYMTKGWQGYETTAVVLYNTNLGFTDADKLYVPGGVEVTFTLTENGDDTLTLSYVCKASVIPTLTPRYGTLSFEDEVYINIYFNLTDAEDVVDLGLIVSSDNVIDENDTMITEYDHKGADTLYAVRTHGIPAKQLGETCYYQVFAKLADGSYVYSRAVPYSALAYAKDRLANSSDAKLKALCVALLNYGAAAQLQFGYNTDALANADLTDAQKALVEPYSESMVNRISQADSTKIGAFANTKGYSKRYPSVSFESAFSIGYYMIPNNTPANGVSMYYWTQETYNSVSVLTAENADGFTTMDAASDTTYKGLVEGIAAKEIDKPVYVAGVYEYEGVSYATGVLVYSLAEYCVDRIANGSESMKVLAEATAVYGYHAKQYFANLNS